MAFKMTPGKSPFMKTGHDIPAPFMQVNTNAGTGEDLNARAKAKAEADAKAKQLAAGENKGGSKDIRNFEGTATVTEKGKKVERIAKTPAEIAAWEKAPKENKEKYLDKSATKTVTISDTGKDQPQVPVEKQEDYGQWEKESVDMNFGGWTQTGRTNSQENIDAKERKLAYDHSRGNQIAPGSNPAGNVYKHQPVTAEEERISNAFGSNAVSPYDDNWSDYGPMRDKDRPDSRIDTSPGSGEKRRQEYIKSIIAKLDQQDTNKKAKQDALAAKKAELRKGLEDRRALSEKARQERVSARDAKKTDSSISDSSSVAMQLKSKKSPAKQMKVKAKTPAKMKKC